MYHHKLDVAADKYDATLDMDEFVKDCMEACQGTVDFQGVIRDAYAFAHTVVPDEVYVASATAVSPEPRSASAPRAFETPPPHHVSLEM